MIASHVFHEVWRCEAVLEGNRAAKIPIEGWKFSTFQKNNEDENFYELFSAEITQSCLEFN